MMPDLSIWAIVLAGVAITVFTLAVTFLGDAIQHATMEREKTRRRKTEDFQLKITDLQNKVSQARESGDSSGVEQKLAEIKKAQKKFDTSRHGSSLAALSKANMRLPHNIALQPTVAILSSLSAQLSTSAGPGRE